MRDQCCIILTTTDDEDVAYGLAELLVKEKLAACVQIDTVDSVFLWDNDLSNKVEYRLMIKCLSYNYSNIEKMICDNHNYEIPQIVKLPITDSLPDYLNWMKEVSTENRPTA